MKESGAPLRKREFRVSIWEMNGVVYSTRGPAAPGTPGQVIMEIWIEELKICINELGYAFESTAPKTAINHFGTFNISDSLCDTIREFVEKKRAFDQINDKIFTALKQRLVDKKTQHNRIVKK